MHRPQFGGMGPQGMNPGSNSATVPQPFFDSHPVAGNTQQPPGYLPSSTTSSLAAAGSNLTSPGQMSQAIHGGYPGATAVTNSTVASIPIVPLANTLTFTPSGSASSGGPSFRNIKTTMKALSDNYETAVGTQFKADAVFLQNYLSNLSLMAGEGSGRLSDSVTDADDKMLAELDIKPDAEIYALLQELSTLDTFKQTAAQALWTARHLPQTATSLLDANFELPPNLDNPTLVELQQTAIDQINFIKKYRRAFVDCIATMAKNVEDPTEADIETFLKSGIYKLQG
ncbi:uncharacterized protein LOC129602749 [Paramacrobiotus metropolitanus]|uniref:uncharacterized protein LOC129602749 n=1 Tax=Paramacrobiotus metropolitanus TaxID=2943436 RepID=UPI002445A7EA|nr:uncharacterized protein LOC129602749 [Paramacrobiotus metropolitanus]